jgi:hypothetical protein
LKLDDVNRVARKYFTPDSLTWVLIGDLANEAPLRQRFPEQVEVWDREGNRVR